MSLPACDSHAHLDMEDFDSDRDDVLRRAWEAGLQHIVLVGLGAEGARKTLSLCARDGRLRAALGIHPHDAALGIAWSGRPQGPLPPEQQADWQKRQEQAFDELQRLLEEPAVAALGEVGLDYHYDHSPRPVQRELFRRLVQLAVERNLPLVIHSREAAADTAAILQEEHAERVGGVLHCFGGDARLAETGLRLGFHFGLAGPLTFRKAEQLRRAATELPLEKLLVETDCPYLAPEPRRGKRNEPAWVVEVVKALAALKGLDPLQVAEQTTANVRRLFCM